MYLITLLNFPYLTLMITLVVGRHTLAPNSIRLCVNVPHYPLEYTSANCSQIFFFVDCLSILEESFITLVSTLNTFPSTAGIGRSKQMNQLLLLYIHRYPPWTKFLHMYLEFPKLILFIFIFYFIKHFFHCGCIFC